jgi:hypothetical protein
MMQKKKKINKNTSLFAFNNNLQISFGQKEKNLQISYKNNDKFIHYFYMKFVNYFSQTP